MERWYAAGARLGVAAKTARDGRVLATSIEGTGDIILNRVLELGLGLAATREGVEAQVAWFRARRAARYLVHVSPSARPTELRDWLLALGLRRFRGWMKFARDPGPVLRPPSSLAVRPVGPEAGEAFARIALHAFDMPEKSAPLLAKLTDLAGWHAFMSFDGETPAGTGALFIEDGVGWLGLGATRPEFRGRGGQGAILAARPEAAFDFGCRVVITETGVAVPGDPQHSYKNILKAGFRELYLRENFAGESSSA